MNQHQFNALLEKYRAGGCTTEEEQLIHAWSEEQLRQHKSPIDSDEQNQIGKRLWGRIRRSTVAPKPFVQMRWFRVSVAASLLLIAGLSWYLTQRPPVGMTDGINLALPKAVVQVQNTSDKPRRITLEDGSLVTLRAGSRISYPEHFGNKTRSVLLEGEAFFAVKKNPAKPFVVHTGDLVTEVLGTSFTIKADKKQSTIEVRVATGRVSVYESQTDKTAKHHNGVILTPNQRVIFDKASHKLMPGLVENPVVIQLPGPGTPRQFMYEETPLPVVLEELKRAFGVEILLENQQLSQCVFTADLTDLPFQAQLDLICKSINATYQQRGTAVFISGEGCP